jgi:hypothetical protein
MAYRVSLLDTKQTIVAKETLLSSWQLGTLEHLRQTFHP